MGEMTASTNSAMPVHMRDIRSFGASHRYYQGPGALALAGDLVRELGRRPLLVADDIVSGLVGPVLRQSLEAQSLPLDEVRLRGEVTRPGVQALLAQALAAGERPDVVIAAGGGKGVDTGKAVALELGSRLVVLPTSASNDGPCSRLFVYYDDAHRMLSVERLPRNPDAVIVDTRLLVRAPRALLVSGIGDALCKHYEGAQTRDAGGLNSYGGRSTLAARWLCEACDQAIRENAIPGLAAVDRGESNEAFEDLTEALVLLSGLAFENSGLSIAHSLTRGLPLIKGTASTLHGYHVAWGLLVQWSLEDRGDAFLHEQLAFYRRVGLPTCLRELGASDASEATCDLVAQGTLTSPHIGHFQRPLSAADLKQAMARVEALAHP